MQITGDLLIGRNAVRGSGKSLRAFNPATAEDIAVPSFASADSQQVEEVCRLAGEAQVEFACVSLEKRALFLEAIAEGIAGLGDMLVERARAETGLPKARIEGERARTIGQLKLFAQLAREGRWIAATLDSPMPERTPVPRSDLRMQRIPLGPVAVFGASNFPLAFSVAGGDTASAFAAGCPVIVKAHRAHLGTSELVGRVIQRAAQELGLPEGVFSLVVGDGTTVGEALVAHPGIKAVGFTGSRAGGLSLMRVAASRPEPIPVYAEMSSQNPVILFPDALKQRAEAVASGFVDSLVLGAGQFCTNPGLVLAIDSPAFASFVESAGSQLASKAAETMLTSGIHDAYGRGTACAEQHANVKVVARGQAASGPSQARAALYVTSAETFLRTPTLREEIFGPAATVVACRDEAQLVEVVDSLDGQLTASMHLATDSPADLVFARQLLPILERKVGRIVANGFPTGVEVSHAMVHGGPFPATSDSRVTSVGTSAIERFLRPVCYQDMPSALLPAALGDANILGLIRLRDGELVRR